MDKKLIDTYQTFCKDLREEKAGGSSLVLPNIAKAYQSLGRKDARKKASVALANVGKSVVALFAGRMKTAGIIPSGIRCFGKAGGGNAEKTRCPQAEENSACARQKFEDQKAE